MRCHKNATQDCCSDIEEICPQSTGWLYLNIMKVIVLFLSLIIIEANKVLNIDVISRNV